MKDLIERKKAIEAVGKFSYMSSMHDIQAELAKIPTVKAIPVENIQKLYNVALEYRDRFKPYSDKWLVANDQAIGVRSVLDMFE